jgi:hypothetical protein
LVSQEKKNYELLKKRVSYKKLESSSIFKQYVRSEVLTAVIMIVSIFRVIALSHQQHAGFLLG